MSVPVIRRLFAEVLSGPRSLDLLDELLEPDYVDHSPLPVYRLAGGRGAEHRDVVDEAGLMARLLAARPAV